jgi:hypothetical protein
LQVEREELLRKRGHEEKVVEVQYITVTFFKKVKKPTGLLRNQIRLDLLFLKTIIAQTIR